MHGCRLVRQAVTGLPRLQVYCVSASAHDWRASVGRTATNAKAAATSRHEPETVSSSHRSRGPAGSQADGPPFSIGPRYGVQQVVEGEKCSCSGWFSCRCPPTYDRNLIGRAGSHAKPSPILIGACLLAPVLSGGRCGAGGPETPGCVPGAAKTALDRYGRGARCRVPLVGRRDPAGRRAHRLPARSGLAALPPRQRWTPSGTTG